MVDKRLVLPILITASILTLVPAAMAAGSTISGTIATPANMSLLTDMNTTYNASVLTIYAMDTKTNFVNWTNPSPSGAFSIPVPEDGMYEIWVSPDAVLDATGYSAQNLTGLKQVQYPQPSPGSRQYYLAVSGDTQANINYFAPGEYVPPNDLTAGSPTPAVTVTPSPTPGFAVVLALAGLVTAFAIVSRRK